MFRWLREFYQRNVAADVPDEIDFCLECGELFCSEDRFAGCARRKARAAELAAAREARTTLAVGRPLRLNLPIRVRRAGGDTPRMM
jgi:hypothetical protein